MVRLPGFAGDLVPGGLIKPGRAGTRRVALPDLILMISEARATNPSFTSGDQSTHAGNAAGPGYSSAHRASVKASSAKTWDAERARR